MVVLPVPQRRQIWNQHIESCWVSACMIVIIPWKSFFLLLLLVKCPHMVYSILSDFGGKPFGSMIECQWCSGSNGLCICKQTSGWPEFFLHRFASCEKLHDQGVALCEVEDFQPLVELFERYQISSYSTAFSGIDSPGTAMAQLGCALTSIMKKQALAPKHLHGIDDRSNCFEYQVFICYLLYIFCFDGDHCDKNVLLIYLSYPVPSIPYPPLWPLYAFRFPQPQQ